MVTVAAVAEVIAWWAATVGLWLLTLSFVTGQDLLLAVLGALPCALAAVLVRRRLHGWWSPPWRSLLWVGRLPFSVASDTVAVLRFPWLKLMGRRKQEGRFVGLPVQAGSDVPACSARAVATALLSMTPCSFVVDEDCDTGELLVHRLVPSRLPIEAAIRR